MLAMFLFLFAFLRPAEAATYSVNFSVNKTAPSASIPSTQVIPWAVFYGDIGSAVDVDIASTWSYLTCRSVNGILLIEFKATRATWPSSWPSSATCTINIGSAGGDTAVLTINILSCTDAKCNRHDIDKSSSTPAACPSGTLTLVSNSYSTDACVLGAPPSGKVYAAPRGAVSPHRGDTPYWSARFKTGSTADPDKDPAFPGVRCGIVGSGTTTVWYLSVVVSDSVPADITVYCPVRLQTTSSKAFSWGSGQVIAVDRP